MGTWSSDKTLCKLPQICAVVLVALFYKLSLKTTSKVRSTGWVQTIALPVPIKAPSK